MNKLELYNDIKTANNPKTYVDAHYPDLIGDITKCAGNTFAQKLYNYLHDFVPTCKMCSNELKWESFRKGYRGTYCSVKCRTTDAVWATNWHHSRHTSKTKAELAAINKKNKETNKKSSKIGQAKARITKLKNGTIKTQEQKSLMELYREQVKLYTGSQPLWLLENYKLRGNHATNPNAYHLDHIYSIAEGFKNGIPPYIIGSIHNLRMMPWRQNITKSSNCDITISQIVDLLSQCSNVVLYQQ